MSLAMQANLQQRFGNGNSASREVVRLHDFRQGAFVESIDPSRLLRLGRSVLIDELVERRRSDGFRLLRERDAATQVRPEAMGFEHVMQEATQLFVEGGRAMRPHRHEQASICVRLM